MNVTEYKSLGSVKSELPDVETLYQSLESREPRTLLYGYNCDRDTWHVYIDPATREIVLYVYNHDNEYITFAKPTELEDLVPDKRVYPACSDYDFCRRLIGYEIYLPFTTFYDVEDPHPGWPYYGEIYYSN